MTKSSGDSESPWKMPLLMLTASSGDSPENKFVFQSFMLFFRGSITFLGAPIRSRDFSIQLCGTIS